MADLPSDAAEVLAFFGRVTDAVHDAKLPAVLPLVDAGFIELNRTFLGYGVYRITNSGRAALESTGKNQ
jgi:hypothetical protein